MKLLPPPGDSDLQDYRLQQHPNRFASLLITCVLSCNYKLNPDEDIVGNSGSALLPGAARPSPACRLHGQMLVQ